MPDLKPSHEPCDVLWEYGPIVCTRLTHETNSVYEVRLYSGEVMISAEFFTESATASQYAFAKQRSYNRS